MRKLALLPFLPFALLVLLVVRWIAPWYLIRFARMWETRMGHFATNTELMLCERAHGLVPRGCDWFYMVEEPCNEQLYKMWRHLFYIDRSGFVALLARINTAFRGWEKHVGEPSNWDRDIHNLLEKTTAHLSFTEKEMDISCRLMIEAGFFDEPFVCLIVRDSAYLPQLSYHSYRDSDIEDYKEAAQLLASRGYYVIRMGKKMGKPMSYASDKIIDYAFSEWRSDFMDIFLAAHCEFALTSSTGIDAVCTIFRRPLCIVNYAPIEYLPTWHKDSLAIFKRYSGPLDEYDAERHILPLSFVYQKQWGKCLTSDGFRREGVTLVNNTPQEIADAAEEIVDGLQKHMKFKQFQFCREFPLKARDPFGGKPLHGKIRLRIGRKFLETVC